MKMGTASIDRKQCIAWAQQKKCLICAEICPTSAVKGAGLLQPRVDADTCVGCGSCQLNCPVEKKAIIVSNAGERRRDG
jgi:ferredoxin